MVNVLLVIPTFSQGGGQKFVLDLAKGLDKSKFRVRILVYYNKGSEAFRRLVQEHGIDTVFLNKKKGLDWRFFSQVRHAIREFKPDVIHTHLNSMLYLLPFYKSRHVKLHTVHTLAEKENYGLQKVVNFIAFHLFGVVPVAICDIVADTIVSTHHLNRKAVPVVYNGVDCKRYSLPHRSSDCFRVVSVGTVYYVKNFPFLVSCFSEVLKKYPNSKLTIVGDGADANRLRQRIKEAGLSDHIIISGVVGNVEDYLADADLYAASSLFEGLPLSILEAMAAGLPILSTNVGGVSDIVQHGVNGLLVEPENKAAYVEALCELIEDTEKRAQLAAASKRLVQNFDESVTVKGYETLYKQ